MREEINLRGNCAPCLAAKLRSSLTGSISGAKMLTLTQKRGDAVHCTRGRTFAFNTRDWMEIPTNIPKQGSKSLILLFTSFRLCPYGIHLGEALTAQTSARQCTLLQPSVAEAYQTKQAFYIRIVSFITYSAPLCFGSMNLFQSKYGAIWLSLPGSCSSAHGEVLKTGIVLAFFPHILVLFRSVV